MCLCTSGDQCYRTRLPFAPPHRLPCLPASADVGLLAERACIPPPILWPRKLSWQAYSQSHLSQTHHSLTGRVSNFVIPNRLHKSINKFKRFNFNEALLLYLLLIISHETHVNWFRTEVCILQRNRDNGLKNFLLKKRVFLIAVLNWEAFRH